MEDGACIEALIRRKPKRVIHNQLLIQTFLTLGFIVPFPLAGVGFWLIFGIYPIITVPAVLIVWVAVLVSYIALKVHNATRSRKSR